MTLWEDTTNKCREVQGEKKTRGEGDLGKKLSEEADQVAQENKGNWSV